jgi:signal transduction histidine kinase
MGVGNAAQTPSSGERRVLALFSDDRLLPANELLDRGLREALLSDGSDIAYFSEYLDSARLPGPGHREALSHYLMAKYGAWPLDAIVAAGRPALQFLLANRRDLFPDVAIVYAGVVAPELDARDSGPPVIALTSDFDVAPTLDLALHLQPETSHVVIVSGSGERERQLTEPLRRAAAAYANRVRFRWLTNQAMAQIQGELRNVAPQTIVIYTALYRDESGQQFVPQQALRRVTAASVAPVYGPFETYVGEGVVGGRMVTWSSTGRAVGRTIKRLLAGESPEVVQREESISQSTLVDWRQLQRWRINPGRLPSGAVVLFQEPGFWQMYWREALVAGAIGVVQLVLIASLAVALRRRRQADSIRLKAEARVAQVRNELAHAARVTTIGELSATLAHELNQPLAAILSNAQAARRWLQRGDPDMAEVRAVVDDIIRDDKRAGEIIHRMRAMLKKSDGRRTAVDLVTVVRDVAGLLNSERAVGDVELSLQTPQERMVVEADEVQTQQVVLNLMKNGIDAIVGSGATRRHVRVVVSRDGRRAVVRVTDSGGGIPEDVRPHIFDPFFSTKAQGLGIGLAICRRIAEAHGGEMEMESGAPGETTFRFSLPLAEPRP